MDRCGYLDDPLSTGVQTSTDLISEWTAHAEADYHSNFFDILDADGVSLIVQTMKKNQRQIEPEKYLDYLKIEMLEKACRENPHLRAAYIYDIR